MDRREFLASAAAAIVSPALPDVAGPHAVMAGVDLAPHSDLLAFAVGTPDEFNWISVFARTPEEAFREWVIDLYGSDTDDDAPAFTPEYVMRVEGWDRLEKVRSVDWLANGLGHVCDRCGYETSRDFGGLAVGDEVVCEDCTTFSDRILADASGAVDEIANRIADEGQVAARAWLEESGSWELAQGDIWTRACEGAS